MRIENFPKLFKVFLFLGLILLLSEVFLNASSILLKSPAPLIPEESGIDAAVQKILCLGDSFTQGLGADRDYSYPAQLEKLLNFNNPGKKFKVFYYGINGLSSSIIANTLEDNIRRYRPSIIIILAGCNDHWNMHQSNLAELLEGSGADVKPDKFKILYNFKTFRLMQLIFNRIVNRRPATAINFSNINDPGLLSKLIEHNYTTMVKAVVSSGQKIKLFFQTYPTGPSSISAIIKRVAQAHRIGIIDQEAIFSRVVDKSPLVSCDDWHLNAWGYNLMAKNIYDVFLKAGIISRALSQDIQIENKYEYSGVAKIDENTWEFDLVKIAKGAERLITLQEGTWCLISNNIVDLPVVELRPAEYALQVRARGTAVKGVYPLVGFYYRIEGRENGLRRAINSGYVSGHWQDYSSRKVKINRKEKVRFFISFENDAYEINAGQVSDRNLYVDKVVLKTVSQ